MKVDWLVWFPLNNTPPNKLRHPVLGCSQDILLAFDPLGPFLFTTHDAKMGKTTPLHYLPSKPTSLFSEKGLCIQSVSTKHLTS